MTAVDLTGAADLHCHFGPDAHRERSVDALDAARQAAEHGHAALVLKSHDSPTAQLAAIVDRVVDGVRVFGGICCDREVGGVNPAAVETALRTGAKVVWLPTLSSRQDQENGVGPALGIPGPGISVVDAEGALRPETHAVLELVSEFGAILATGHVSAAEHLAVAHAFGRKGKLLVTHALEELAGPNLDVGQCIELADLGARVELCALTCIGALATRAPAEIAAAARAIGVHRVTLASDFGQKANVPPAEGLARYASALVDAGLGQDDVRTMARTNPCDLLDIDP